MMPSKGGIVTEVDGSADSARQRAQEIAVDTNREVLPVRVFKQGPRMMLSGVLPVRVLVRVLANNSSSKGETAAKAVDSMNRPVISEHVTVIMEYLKNALAKNEKYVLPGMTLNATRGVEVYVPKGMIGPTTGYAVLPEEQFLYITDGQHRYLAIKKVVEALRGSEAGDNFMSDGVPVMITIEEDVKQRHQDFADAGKTKALPPSLLAVYDMRQYGNKAVHAIIDGVPLFKDRIDATSATLSKNSPYLFLVNQVRQFVKSSLTNNPSMTDPAFGKHAETALSDETAMRRWVASRILFLEILTELIPDWKTIARLPKPQGPDGPQVLAKMRELRDIRAISLSAAALNTLGLVSYKVLGGVDISNTTKTQQVLSQVLDPIRNVDWDRTSPFWENNLVVSGTVVNRTSSVRSAANALMNVLGINDNK